MGITNRMSMTSDHPRMRHRDSSGAVLDFKPVPHFRGGQIGLSRIHRISLLSLALGLVTGPWLVGCNLLTPLIFVGEHKKKIAPEFDKLPGHRVAVLAWAAPATLFDYPHARFELSSYIADKIAAETAQQKLDVDVVDSRDVEDFLQKSFEAQTDPAIVGRKFDADFVIYFEIVRFQIRDPHEPQFLQGQIEATVSVYDLRTDSQRGQRYDLIPVTITYPETAPMLMSATNSPLVRETTYRKFAEEVARKFYEHSVEL